jgi:2-amino-4-hydroxy-6-hydroxymethyldihydropteridine diphosphokinase
MSDVAYIALGSNLGDREAYLAFARSALSALDRTRVIAMTSIEETEPFGEAGQGPYLNQMLALETELSPRTLLGALQRIERVARRTRAVRWGSRTLDLDIVAFEHHRASEPDLYVPHRGLPDRDFWQRQLIELRGDANLEMAR